jgi:hypothetical protein
MDLRKTENEYYATYPNSRSIFQARVSVSLIYIKMCRVQANVLPSAAPKAWGATSKRRPPSDNDVDHAKNDILRFLIKEWASLGF